MTSPSKYILITGVSTGIGYGTAQELIRRGYAVLGSVRKQEDAQRLKEELGPQFTPLIFDVTDAVAIHEAVVRVKEILGDQGLGGLINNSGISVTGPLELLSVEEVTFNFEVNVFGLLRVTKAFLPLLGAQPGLTTTPGRILNISSVAGKISAPYMAPYGGTKHAVEAFSQSMRLEFARYNIPVIIIGPGPIQTPIWDKGSLDKFAGTTYFNSLAKFFTKFVAEGKNGMPLEECARQITDIFEKPKPKARYSIVKNKFFFWTLPRLLPTAMLDDYFRKQI